MAGRFRTVLLFGAPGVGKGTQGKLLGAIPGFVHMASGDIFRSLDPRSELGRKCHQYSSQGLLVPDEVTIAVWQAHAKSRIEKETYRPEVDLLILDGIPRNVAQAEALEQHLTVLAIVHLKAPDVDGMVARLKSRAAKEGRQDDTDETVIRRRFKVYEDETSPVLGHYDAALISEIDAIGPPAAVLLRILETVAGIYTENFHNPLG